MLALAQVAEAYVVIRVGEPPSEFEARLVPRAVNSERPTRPANVVGPSPDHFTDIGRHPCEAVVILQNGAVERLVHNVQARHRIVESTVTGCEGLRQRCHTGREVALLTSRTPHPQEHNAAWARRADTLRHSVNIARIRLNVGLVAATTVAYVGWLGWDQHKTLGPDGYLHGPYEAWQVVGTALTLGGLAAFAGWRGRTTDATIVVTSWFVLLWAADAAIDADSDGSWPVSIVLVGLAT